MAMGSHALVGCRTNLTDVENRRDSEGVQLPSSSISPSTMSVSVAHRSE